MPRPGLTEGAGTSSPSSELPVRDRWFGMRRAVAIGYQPAVAEVADLLAEHDRLRAGPVTVGRVEARTIGEASQALQRMRDIARQLTGEPVTRDQT